MDIEDELPLAPAPAGGGGEPSQALLSGDQFDVEAYAAQYTGRTRVARLLFIADKSPSEQMQLDALRLAYEASLKGEDTALHRDVTAKIAGRLGPRYALDQAWSDALDRRSLVRKEKLDSELNGYKVPKP
jgi:COP9 signalosome complex subunit 1